MPVVRYFGGIAAQKLPIWVYRLHERLPGVSLSDENFKRYVTRHNTLTKLNTFFNLLKASRELLPRFIGQPEVPLRNRGLSVRPNSGSMLWEAGGIETLSAIVIDFKRKVKPAWDLLGIVGFLNAASAWRALFIIGRGIDEKAEYE